MLSDDVSDHQILKIFLGGHAPRPPTWAADVAVSAFGRASAPSLQNYFLRLCQVKSLRSRDVKCCIMTSSSSCGVDKDLLGFSKLTVAVCQLD